MRVRPEATEGNGAGYTTSLVCNPSPDSMKMEVIAVAKITPDVQSLDLLFLLQERQTRIGRFCPEDG
jgi:hypothetical protein